MMLWKWAIMTLIVGKPQGKGTCRWYPLSSGIGLVNFGDVTRVLSFKFVDWNEGMKFDILLEDEDGVNGLIER